MEQHRIVIIGGGIAGLSTAYALERELGADAAITIIERDERLGGKLRTAYVALPDSDQELVIEAGPDAFIVQKPWGIELARELGLGEELIETQPARHKVHILVKGRPHPVPDGVILVVPTDTKAFLRSPIMSWPGKLRTLLEPWVPQRRAQGDEALGAFIRRRLGREALDKIGEPLMAGIHNAESERLSLAATFPRFQDVEARHGSLIRGLRQAQRPQSSGQPTSPFISLRGGIATLVDALVGAISAERRLGVGVTGLAQRGQGYEVQLSDGSALGAESVVLALPAYGAAELVRPFAPELAAGLSAIRYVSTGTITLAYRRSEVKLPFDSYGLLIPRSERRRINAITISSRKFAGRAPEDIVLVRVFVGGSHHPDVIAREDGPLMDLVRAELWDLLGINVAPVWTGIYRWPLANPQYDVGHLERIAGLEAQCPAGVYLCGSAYRGVGIPDCVRQGRETAAQIVERARSVAAGQAVGG